MRKYGMTLRQIEFEKYLNSREFLSTSTLESKPKIFKTLQSELEPLSPSTSDYLVQFSTRGQSFCVGFVDIVNSTKISAGLSAEKLPRYYEIFLNSMSKIIGKFGGKVIKSIGDSLLYYFPESSNFSENGIRSCLDCGLAMVQVQNIISEEMVIKKLPNLKYRISSDFGSVILMNTNFTNTVDLIGPPVNMCSKINRCAKDNEFVIGNDLHQITKNLRGYGFHEIKSCDIGLRYSYPVYNVTSC